MPPGKTVPLIQKPMARDTLDLKKARPGHGRCDRIRCVSGLTCVIYVFGMPIPIDINCCIWTEVQNFHSLVMIVMKLVCSALSWSKFGYWYDHGSSGSWRLQVIPPSDIEDPPMKASRIHAQIHTVKFWQFIQNLTSVMQTVCTNLHKRLIGCEGPTGGTTC